MFDNYFISNNDNFCYLYFHPSEIIKSEKNGILTGFLFNLIY